MRRDLDDKSDIRVKISELMSAICMSRGLGLWAVSGQKLPSLASLAFHWLMSQLAYRGMAEVFCILMNTTVQSSSKDKKKKSTIIIEQLSSNP